MTATAYIVLARIAGGSRLSLSVHIKERRSKRFNALYRLITTRPPYFCLFPTYFNHSWLSMFH